MYVVVSSVTTQELNRDEGMAPAALTVSQSPEHLAVQLTEFQDFLCLGSGVDSNLT